MHVLLKPENSKVRKILNLNIPTTKKQVRCVVGLLGYYRKFVPNFATIVAPLTELINNGKPNKVDWTESVVLVLKTIQMLSSSPIYSVYQTFAIAFCRSNRCFNYWHRRCFTTAEG